MTALAHEITVPAYPLGRPVDGRERFSMTPDQARVYRWLVQTKPHGEPFKIDFRKTGTATGYGTSTAHSCVVGLCQRGWMAVVPSKTKGIYRFVQPVMMFKEPRHG